MPRIIRIMLVEDNPEYREALRYSLRRKPEIKLDRQFGTAEMALRDLQENPGDPAPDLILLDLNLPNMSGIEALPWIRQYAPQTKVMVLTQSEAEADVFAAISAGASGYLLKSASLEKVCDGIRTIMDGGASLDPAVAAYIFKVLERKTPKNDPGVALTKREMEILQLLADGLVKKEIASKLGISANTVAIHVTHIYEKLEVKNAPAAVGKAYRRGIIQPE